MTDEKFVPSESAEKYYYDKYHVTLNIGEEYRFIAITQAFDAGLAEGKPKWHDLREDPNDLPPKENTDSSYSINVFTDTEENAFYSYYYNIWVRESDGLRIPKVIAWTELPKFKEK